MKTEGEYVLAHPGKRFQGQFIDGLVSLVLFVVGLSVVEVAGLSGFISEVVICILPAAYFLLADAMPNGQSIGKILLGMSVIDRKTGGYCTLRQSFLRNITTPILGTIDAVVILFNGHRRIGDMLASTIVVKKNAN